MGKILATAQSEVRIGLYTQPAYQSGTYVIMSTGVAILTVRLDKIKERALGGSMKKETLLRAIAECAYNVGYSAKLNFATMDIVEKMPGILGFLGLAVGIAGLVIVELATPGISAIFIVLSIVALYISMYQGALKTYDAAGRELTECFNDLKRLYLTVRDSDTDLVKYSEQFEVLERRASAVSSSKQILFADWYAHYKFFWQQQIGWVDEQMNFSLLRDKVPLSAWIVLVLLLTYLGYMVVCALVQGVCQ